METIFSLIEPFGRYQKKTCFLIGISSALAAMTIYTTLFTAAKPALICRSLLSNSTNLTTCEAWSNFTQTRSMHGIQVFTCEFEKKFYGRTLITDFELVCDREYLANLAQSFYMFGGFSVLFSGWFGDRFGRRKSTSGFLILLTFTLVINQLIQGNAFKISMSQKYIFYCITQFLTGAFSFSMYTSSYVLLMESTIEKYHTLFSIINLYFYIFGELLSVLISFFLREWEIINLIMMSFSVMMIFFIQLFLPESPRWLVSSGQFDRAYKQIVHISRYNGKKFNSVDYKINSETDFLSAFDSISEIDENMGKHKSKNMSIKSILFEILHPKKNFLKTFLLGIIWITVSLLYFGVSLGITAIKGIDPYLIVILSSIAEAVGYSLCFFNSKYGHRITNMFYMSFSAVVCLAIGLITSELDMETTAIKILVIILTIIGKCMVSASFNTCFIYSTEYYSTSVRNFVLLFLSSLGCIGSIIAPQINLLADLVWEPMPFLIFTVFAFLATLSGFVLRKI